VIQRKKLVLQVEQRIEKVKNELRNLKRSVLATSKIQLIWLHKIPGALPHVLSQPSPITDK